MVTAMPQPLVKTLRILLVSAVNPDDPPLDVDEEFAGILDRLGGHGHVLIQQRTALTMDRLMSALLKFRPHILHFASHGVPGYLLLRSPDIHSTGKISSSALTHLFGAIGRDLRLVVFNACDSLDMARAVVSAPNSPVDWAIGMATRICDDDAVKFSAALYGVLSAGEAIGAAFKAALAMLETQPASAKDKAPVEIPRLLPEDPTTADATPLVAPPATPSAPGHHPLERVVAAEVLTALTNMKYHAYQCGKKTKPAARKAVTLHRECHKLWVDYLYQGRSLLWAIRADANKDPSSECKELLMLRAKVEKLEPQPPDQVLLGVCQAEVRAEIRPRPVKP